MEDPALVAATKDRADQEKREASQRDRGHPLERPRERWIKRKGEEATKQNNAENREGKGDSGRIQPAKLDSHDASAGCTRDPAIRERLPAIARLQSDRESFWSDRPHEFPLGRSIKQEECFRWIDRVTNPCVECRFRELS